jgi:hypothetical protein
VIVRLVAHCRRRYKRECGCRVPATVMAPGPPKVIGSTVSASESGLDGVPNIVRYADGALYQSTGLVKFGQRYYNPASVPSPSKTPTRSSPTPATATSTPTPPTALSTIKTQPASTLACNGVYSCAGAGAVWGTIIGGVVGAIQDLFSW